jgi:tetratricopeptide (TPR) repeat protein
MTLPIYRTLAAAALAGLSFTQTWAQQLEGADSVLRKVSEQLARKSPATANPAAALRQKLEAFDRDSKNLPPDQAATQWLALVEAYNIIPREMFQQAGSYAERLTFERLLRSLPRPESWKAVSAAIQTSTRDKRDPRALSLRVLGSVLNQDDAGAITALQSIQQAASADEEIESYEKDQINEAARKMKEALEKNSRTAPQQVAAFVAILDQIEKPSGNENEGRFYTIEIPDLVKLAGKEAATPLITRALKTGRDIAVQGDATRKLAAQLALKEIGNLKKPVWHLVHSPDEIALYEALVAAFPKSDEGQDYHRTSADAVYMLSLIATGRTQDAVAFVKRSRGRVKDFAGYLSGHTLEGMRQQGLGSRVLAFLQEILTDEPSLPLWRDFIALSAQEHQAKQALTVLRAALAKPGLAPDARANIQAHYYAALLAANETEEGIKVLRELVKGGPRAEAAGGGNDIAEQFAKAGLTLSPEQQMSMLASSRSIAGEEDPGTLALKLARIGVLLERPELVEEGLSAARAELARTSSQRRYGGSSLSSIVDILLETGRTEEAEELAVANLLSVAGQKENRMAGIEPLSVLCRIYESAGRHADVVKLLEKSPMWGAPDLAAVTAYGSQREGILVVAAKSLAAVGRKDEAHTVARRAVQMAPGNDAAYAVLMEVGGNTLAADLEQMSKIDRFEERPLIWKARLQLDQGNTAEAERTIRAAIAIDPSDGEQGKGDRMRAYAVLGDVLEKKGDKEQAALMRSAVTAIRLSERADDWWSAGLLSRAVDLYEQALKQFADAYCIQSRLALRYSELGDFEKAEQHYRRAFELMPDSFGRVESHCFGCEGAFEGERAQGIAQQVFQSLVQKFPERAQIHYLLGYLRSSQSWYEDAANLYRKAVELDPDYLNAWVKLQGLSEQVLISPDERQKIALAILRLDPMAKRGSPELGAIPDLAALWNTILAIEQAAPPQETGPILPLPASRQVITQAVESRGSDAADFESMLLSRMADAKSPRQLLVQHPVMEAMSYLIDNQNSFSR